MPAAKNIQKLLNIMSTLRHPTIGCPWSLKQNFKTIIPYTIEEVYEVVDAIERNDKDDLCNELGDLLYQIIFYAQLAEEEKSFTFTDVVQSINEKMTRRHPHVFGDKKTRNLVIIAEQWKAIKSQEKAERFEKRQRLGIADDTEKGPFQNVKTSLPTYVQTLNLQKKAHEIGYSPAKPQQTISALENQCQLISQKIATNQLNDQDIGQLIFDALQLSQQLQIDPRAALAKANRQFRQKFENTNDND